MVQSRTSSAMRALVAVAVVTTVGLAPISAQAADPVPLAARLLAEPYTNGAQVVVDNLSGMYGLATDGTRVYVLDDTGNVLTIPVADIDTTAGTLGHVTGTVHAVGWGLGTAPSIPALIPQLSISYSHGCLFITDGSNSAATGLYCIDVSDWSVTQLVVPSAHPLPVGDNYMIGAVLDLPDGRIGKISRDEPVAGGYESVLRTYSLGGTGKDVTLAFSEDFTFFDVDAWAIDEHGIATDGTYLYRIQYNYYHPNFKSWKLVSGATSTVEYEGDFTEPFINMHFLAHNHVADYYLVGDHDGNSFYITESADAGPGPGSPLTPEFGIMVPGSHGCTNDITNYDAAFTWTASAVTGTAAINSAGGVSATGLPEGTSSTVTVQTTRSGYPTGSSTFSCIAAPADPPDAPTAVTAKPENNRASFSWRAPSHPGYGGILDYTVQVQDSLGVDIPGATCTTRTRFCSVEGLHNGTDYLVVVKAQNFESFGPWSAPTAFTPGVPVLTPLGTTSTDLTLSDATPSEGDTVTFTADGFRAGTQVDFWIHSTPTLLGSAIVAGSGMATLTVALPAGFTGIHTIQAVGVSFLGSPLNLTQPITIAARPSALSYSGFDAAPWAAGGGLLLVAGLVLVVGRRRARLA